MYYVNFLNCRFHYPFPQHCNGLIAYGLLFHSNQTMMKELTEPNRIKCIFNDAKNIIKLGQESLDQVWQREKLYLSVLLCVHWKRDAFSLSLYLCSPQGSKLSLLNFINYPLSFLTANKMTSRPIDLAWTSD